MILSGFVEEFSGKAKLTGRKAYELRTPQGIAIGLFQPLEKRTTTAKAGAPSHWMRSHDDQTS